jgi:hypothetical protein
MVSCSHCTFGRDAEFSAAMVSVSPFRLSVEQTGAKPTSNLMRSDERRTKKEAGRLSTACREVPTSCPHGPHGKRAE